MVLPLDAGSSDHLDAWGRMRLALFPDLEPAFNEADMAALLRRPEQHVRLVFVNDAAVGFVELALRNLVDGCLSSPVGYLEGIWVAPEFRGRGLSTLLLESALEWAREQGCTEFASDSDLADVEAQAWHRANGFAETFRVVQFRREV